MCSYSSTTVYDCEYAGVVYKHALPSMRIDTSTNNSNMYLVRIFVLSQNGDRVG